MSFIANILKKILNIKEPIFKYDMVLVNSKGKELHFSGSYNAFHIGYFVKHPKDFAFENYQPEYSIKKYSERPLI